MRGSERARTGATRQPTGTRLRHAGLACLTAVLGALLVCLAGIAPAAAHSTLLASTPEQGVVLDRAPRHVELRFDESVQIVPESTRLLEAGGGSRDLRATAVDSLVTIDLPSDLPDGGYTVAYRIVSADGHPVGGALDFGIGTAGNTGTVTVGAGGGTGDQAAVEVAVAVLTALQYIGLLALAGLLFFDRMLLVGRNPGARVTRMLEVTGFCTAGIASLLLVPVDGARVTGGDAFGFDAQTFDITVLPPDSWLAGVSPPPIAVACMVFVCGLAALLLSRRCGRMWSVCALACAGMALASPVLIGHTQTKQPTWLMILADLGHLLAGAFWLGGVLGLVCYLWAVKRVRPGPDNGAVRNEPGKTPLSVVARFSRWAPVAVLVLAGSGLLMGRLVLGSWGNLADALLGAITTGGYGRLLALKFIIVVVVIILAALNRLWLLPRIGSRAQEMRRWRDLRLLLVCEAGVLCAVLVVTGFLTNTAPQAEQGAGDQRTAAASPDGELRGTSQDLLVEGTPRSSAVGTNTVELHVRYRDQPLEAERITVSTALPEQELGPLSARVSSSGAPGEYTASVRTPVAGQWRIRVTARVDEFTEPVVDLTVTIR